MKDVSILGCGWLGKPLAEFLFEKGFEVKGSTTSLNKLEDLKSVNISPFLVDISSSKNFEEFLSSEVLIIAITSKDLEAFKGLISQIEKSLIKKVIFISSTSVYPSLNKEMTEEGATINSPLVQIENEFKNNQGFKTTIIRFAGLLGVNRNPANWFEGRKIPQPNGFVNMIHQEDCVEIIYQVIQQDVFGEVFNACSNHHPTRKEFYTNAKKRANKEKPIFDDSQPLKYKIINSDKLQKRLSYTFKFDDLLTDKN